ncbi:unnamed protein product [Strongylus vulgaris]|uniref:Uncharacterized protein n=1 Tax=Strongylus vulgaris TaxID=40348 RepID=A0A3P7J4P8_STRVU|nr:unnamed protein product [Strongylus vulgaris]
MNFTFKIDENDSAGDWLQGPHVYALYESYGMSKHQIEVLFIAGFGSSLLFGTVIGSFADKLCVFKFVQLSSAAIFGIGRRNNCLIYGILYGLACVTKHFGIMEVLMIGRFLGGISTSILFSAFESWLVYEHNKRGFSESALATVFSHAALDVNVLCLGLVQSLFEGSMYTFAYSETIPHGYIFASFMVAAMMGSSLFKLLSKTGHPENFMRFVLLLSAACLAVPVIAPTSAVLVFIAFLVFEVRFKRY